MFVVGCPRSGTTLLAVILDRHSQIAATPETHFLTSFATRFFNWEQQHSTNDLARALCHDQFVKDLDLNTERVVGRIGTDSTTLRDLLGASLQEYAAGRSKQFCVEKTPSHIFYVKQLLEWYPRARIVCMVRDGRDAVQSMERMPGGLRSPRGHAAIWRQAAIAAERWADQFPDRFQIVRFEELLTEPEATLEIVMAHLGLSFEPEQLRPTSESSPVPLWESEWKNNALRELDPSRIHSWRKNATPSQLHTLNSMMAGYLSKFGYDDPYACLPISLESSIEASLNFCFRTLYDYRLIPYRRWGRQCWRRFVPARTKKPTNGD